MATIRKRNQKWQVQVRRHGAPALNRTFTTKRDADTWAREIEMKIERQDLLPNARNGAFPTFAALLERYRETVTPKKRSAPVERYRIGLILRHDLAKFSADQLTTEVITAFRDERLKSVSGDTVRQDLVLIHQVLETARREWGLGLTHNPASEVRKPRPAPGRTRRLVNDEERRLWQALAMLRSDSVRDAILFALASGMRRGEILRMEWTHVDYRLRVLTIPETKNGYPRIIPLSDGALSILERRKAKTEGSRAIFQTSANALKLAWRRLREREGFADLRFHDLRHEAISRFFEAGLSLPEVALISGHRDPRMLLRYTHMFAARIAEKLSVKVKN